MALVTGEIPMVYADTNGTYYPWDLSQRNQDLLGYVQRIASFRTTYGYRFAVLGQTLRPPRPTVPAYHVPAATAIPYTNANTSAFDTPSILSGAWLSPEGDAVLVFTNVSDGPVSFSWTITSADVPLIMGKTYDLYVLKNGACASEQPASAIPYALHVDSNPADIITVILSQSISGAAPRFPGCSPALPFITAVANAAGGQAGVISGSFVSIYGSNFTSLAYDDWGKSISNGQLPRQLDGLSVTIGGKQAYIYAITPGQINVQAPDVNAGNVPVVVTTSAGSSAPFTVVSQQYAPAFWLWPGNQPVATHAYSCSGPDCWSVKNGTFSVATVAAKPNEVITLWGTGFGPTTPIVPAGQLPDGQFHQISGITVTVGGFDAQAIGALSTFPGNYQINITVPASLSDGDYPVVAAVNGVRSPQVTLTVQH